MNCLIYHHNDQDGYLAATVVYEYLCKQKETMIKYAVGKYEGNNKIDMGKDHIYLLEWADTIFIVDYSLADELMKKYIDKIIWIDHHQTAIDRVYKISKRIQRKFEGLQRIGESGCLLAWKYFHLNAALPAVIKYVNDRDVWNWKYGDETAAFHIASSKRLTDIENYWYELLHNDDLTMKEITEIGLPLLQYEREMCDIYNKAFGWKGTFMGHPVIFLNSGIFSGELHKRLRENEPGIDFCIVWVHKPTGEVKVGMYGRDDKDNYNLGEIAQKFGGGGHKKAGGFHIDPVTWANILKESKNGTFSS